MRRWAKKEQRDAGTFNGRRVPGSGNKWNKPGDVKTSLFLIEDKTTEKKSFAVTQKLWDSIRRKALLSPHKTARIPLLSIELLQTGTELIVLDKNDFLQLTSLENLET